jgi:hypothetical protein
MSSGWKVKSIFQDETSVIYIKGTVFLEIATNGCYDSSSKVLQCVAEGALFVQLELRSVLLFYFHFQRKTLKHIVHHRCYQWIVSFWRDDNKGKISMIIDWLVRSLLCLNTSRQFTRYLSARPTLCVFESKQPLQIIQRLPSDLWYRSESYSQHTRRPIIESWIRWRNLHFSNIDCKNIYLLLICCFAVITGTYCMDAMICIDNNLSPNMA